MIRILIVDDTSTIRLGLRLILENDPDLTVVGEARSGEDAIELCRKLRPDIITMDIIMPGMGGYEAIRKIMSETPCPIVVLTGIESEQLMEVNFKALKLGALTVLQKPDSFDTNDSVVRHLIKQIKLMATIKVVRRTILSQTTSQSVVDNRTTATASSRRVVSPSLRRPARLVAIGTSTGGPPALQVILSGLPSNFPLPIVVVQHMSRGFISGLAKWLSKVTPLQCKIGEHCETLQPGIVYLAPDNNHMTFTSNRLLWLDPSDPIKGHRPSVTALFESVAQHFRSEAIGILLTGMGEDGAIGLKTMKQKGAYTIAQDEASSVVFGMPRAAIELEAVDEVLSCDTIAPWLRNLAERITN